LHFIIFYRPTLTKLVIDLNNEENVILYDFSLQYSIHETDTKIKEITATTQQEYENIHPKEQIIHLLNSNTIHLTKRRSYLDFNECV
jgi:hypothetical protein